MTDVPMAAVEHEAHSSSRKRPRSPSSAADLTLFCCLVGSNTPFPVDISGSRTVGHLKEIIKKKKPQDLKGMDADKLELFKVSLPSGRDLEKRVKDAIDNIEPLDPTTKLAKIFFDEPPEETVHIAVKLPDDADNFPTGAPSDLAKPSALDKFQAPDHTFKFGYNRPPSAASALPVTLLHPIFNEFIDDCEHYKPSNEDHSFALNLAHLMCGFFKNEKERQAAFIQICQENGLSFTPSKIVGTDFTTDGDMHCNGFMYCLGDIKNETGSNAAEPIFQSACYYTAHLKNRQASNIHSTFPCLGLYVIGPILGFIGLAFDVKTQIQVLTQPIRFDYHHTDVKQRRTAARYLGAFRRTARKLKIYYETEIPKLKNLPVPSSAHQSFPCYSRYTALSDSAEHEIQYIAQPMGNKLVFHGKSGGAEVCVKFVTRYSKEAHLHCVKLGIAPVLRGFESLPGGWFMVVMDWIGNDYVSFDIRATTDLHHMHRVFMDKLGDFHRAGYVHGDIRNVNVMVRRDGELMRNNGEVGFMLLDFDWSGRTGEVSYPMNVNKGNGLWRPEDVKDEVWIQADHDLQMLNHMFEMLTD
ncbi:hypothetical protein VKT23_011167 [Stygiomarasmius scandens]|uniref:Crinkler effector protein N-terminal domain-containing protein n=1 Tax=Marasmiellus scandens TaxID=2682957 RepID=A0ABR1JAY5_9AGAR